MTGLRLRRHFAAFAATFLLVPIMDAGLCGCGSGKENEKLSDIQELIAGFRDGQEFDGDAGRFLVDGRPDETVLGAIDSALIRESEHVREQLCHLLADMGRRADALYDAGGGLIRVGSIVERLAGELLARQTSERDAALARRDDEKDRRTAAAVVAAGIYAASLVDALLGASAGPAEEVGTAEIGMLAPGAPGGAAFGVCWRF